METDKKLVALVLVTAVTVFGIAVMPSGGSYPLLRYVLADGGQFLIALLAAWIGLERAKYFSFGSGLGRSLLYMSLGMLSAAIGMLAWAYYNVVLAVEVPYPSIVDLFYLLAYPLGGYGLFSLLRGMDIKLDAAKRLRLLLLPLAVFIVVHLLFVQSSLAENVPILERALNILYPFGDAVLVSMALLILDFSRGSAISRPVGVIAAGFVVLVLADFSFAWSTSSGAYYTGSVVDMLFSISFFVIGAGMYLMSGSYFMKELSDN